MPAHNHLAGSFKKVSSKAKRVEAKRARYFARQQVLANQQPSPARAPGGADDEAKPPLDLLVFRPTAEVDDGDAQPIDTPAKRVRTASSPPRHAQDDVVPPFRSPKADDPIPATPVRGGNAARGFSTTAKPARAPDAIARRCYEQLDTHPSAAWQSLNGSLFEQLPFEMGAAPSPSPSPVERGGARLHSAPACGGSGARRADGGAPHAETLLGLLADVTNFDLDDADVPMYDGSMDACPPGAAGAFHHVVVQQTYWRSSAAPTPVAMATDSPGAQWAQQHGAQAWIRRSTRLDLGYSPDCTPGRPPLLHRQAAHHSAAAQRRPGAAQYAGPVFDEVLEESELGADDDEGYEHVFKP